MSSLAGRFLPPAAGNVQSSRVLSPSSVSLESMTRETKELLERALKLPPKDRVKLARELLESVPESAASDGREELSAEWKAEIERRLADEPSAEDPWHTGEEVLARLREELDKKRPRKPRRGT